MPTTQTDRGISNGHWERPEPRSAWLLLLARMSAVELRALTDLARSALHHHEDEAEVPTEAPHQHAHAAE